MHVHLEEKMKSLIAILLSLVKPSYQETERFQQRPFQIIEHKQGQVCLSNTDGWYTAPTVRACASLISMEQSQTGATVFTFDSTHFICRTYIEENFNVCFFDVCSGCVSYKCSNPQDSTSTAYYPETSSVTLTAKPETTTTYTGNPETDSVTNSMVTTTTANTGKNIYVCSLVSTCATLNSGLLLSLKIVRLSINHLQQFTAEEDIIMKYPEHYNTCIRLK